MSGLSDDTKRIPFIVVHRGGQRYLKECLDYAAANKHQVVLLGDCSNQKYEGINIYWHDYSDFGSEAMHQFNSFYQHFSTNPFEYERFCFERHFLVYEYARRNHLDSFFVMDSDVLLGKMSRNQREKLRGCFGEHDAALCWPEKQGKMEWTVSPHFSWWRIDALKDFLNYLLEIYQENLHILKEKAAWHRQNDLPGGICDMTLLYLWMESGRKRVMNFCSNDNVDLGIDMQYKTDQENSRYLVKDRIERIVFRKGRPFYINKENAALIPAFDPCTR